MSKQNRDLVRLLIQKTRDGTLTWEHSASSDIFWGSHVSFVSQQDDMTFRVAFSSHTEGGCIYFESYQCIVSNGEGTTRIEGWPGIVALPIDPVRRLFNLLVKRHKQMLRKQAIQQKRERNLTHARLATKSTRSLS